MDENTVVWALVLAIALFTGIGAWNEQKDRLALRAKRWPGNLFLLVVLSLLSLVLPVSALAGTALADQLSFGLGSMWAMPYWLAFATWWVAASLLQYFVHYFSHKYPVLWSMHRVHHSDDIMDSTTGFRHHPLELVIESVATFSLALLLAPPETVVAAWTLIGFFLLVWNHSNLRLPAALEQALEWIVVTPRMHNTHHSTFQPETDSNYGTMLSIWDHAFGTYRVAEPKAFGLDDMRGDQLHDPFWLILSPISFLKKRWSK